MNTNIETQKNSARALTSFFLLAFGITWGLSVFTVKDILPFHVPPILVSLSAILLHYGPAIAAIFMAGRGGIKDLVGRLAIWHVGSGWYGFVFLYPLALRLTATGVDMWLGGKPPEFLQSPGLEGVNPVLLLPVVFIVVFFQAGLAEEIGWRGYALPRLLQRFGPLTSSLILGVIWGAWHFHPQNAAQILPLAPWYFLDILAFTIVLTWVFNKTGGSLLLVALLHTASNVSDWIVPTFPAVAGAASLRPFIIQGGLGWVAVIVIGLQSGVKTVRRKIPFVRLAETNKK